MDHLGAGISERQGSLELESEPALCPACGRRARFRARRARAQIFECEATDCPLPIFEVLLSAPELPQRWGGRAS